MPVFSKSRIATAVTLCSAIAVTAGCGGSSSSEDDASETSVVSRGVITGFGSVYVNGRRYATDRASFQVDDDAGSESDLRVGMIATVRGYSDDGGRSWRARRVSYDNELKGPVSSIVADPADATRKTVAILGQAVLIDANTTFDDDYGLSFDSIAVGNVLEVSGHSGPSGVVATHVELQADDLEIEIRGRIENLVGDRFKIRGFPVAFDAMTKLDGIAVLADGLYVEVEGRLDSLGTTLLAQSIEREDDDFDDADEVEIEGMITDFNPTNKTFKIGEQRVDAATAELIPATLVLADDLIVEVEGYLVADILVADEVKQRGKKIEIDAPLAAVGDDSIGFRFNGVDVVARVGRGTELEDGTGNPVFSLADFMPGDFVEFEAFADGSGVINAVEIERQLPDEISIEAPVEGFDRGNRTVTLLGVDFDLSAARFENAADVEISAGSFFDALGDGVFIEIEDADRNGVFDKAELED